MAISFVAGNTGTTGNNYASSYTVAKPTNTNGDLIVAIVGGKGASISGSGWTLLMQTSARSGGSMDQTSVYYKFASSEGTGNYTVSLSASQLVTGWIGAYRGVDSTTPIDTTDKAITHTSGTDYTPTSETATAGQWGIVFAIAYNFGTGTVGTYSESPSPSFERADFGTSVSGNPDNTSMVVAEYQALSAGTFHPTITRNHTADTGDCGVLFLNVGSTDASPTAGVATVTASTAYDVTGAQGVAALADVATVAAVTATEADAPGVQYSTATAQAYVADTDTQGKPVSRLAAVQASALGIGAHYGAPPGRTMVVGNESRTFLVTRLRVD